MSIFVIISGAAMSLLNGAQKRYQTEGQMLSSFQEGRLAVDQIARDVDDAGYPALNQFSAVVPVTNYAQTPVAWAPGYVGGAACTIGGACTTPGNFDLILEEANISSGNVQWIHYQLVGTTLYRGAVNKVAATDPSVATAMAAVGVMFPYATNVVNNAPAAQIAQINATYPGTFPGGAPVPIFSYTCDTGAGGIPTTCPTAGAFNSPANVRDIDVTLIIQTQQKDLQTGQLRVVTLHGRGHRINPNQ